MAQTDYPLTADDGPDDLPRTLRRAKEEREREAREREAMERMEPQLGTGGGQTYPDAETYAAGAYADDPVPAVVKRFDVPFLRLMLFFIKAVLAAIPAMILFLALMWLAGDIMQRFFPWLIKMQVFIHFPE